MGGGSSNSFEDVTGIAPNQVFTTDPFDLQKRTGSFMEESFLPEDTKQFMTDTPVLGDSLSRGWLGETAQQFTQEGQDFAMSPQGQYQSGMQNETIPTMVAAYYMLPQILGALGVGGGGATGLLTQGARAGAGYFGSSLNPPSSYYNDSGMNGDSGYYPGLYNSAGSAYGLLNGNVQGIRPTPSPESSYYGGNYAGDSADTGMITASFNKKIPRNLRY